MKTKQKNAKLSAKSNSKKIWLLAGSSFAILLILLLAAPLGLEVFTTSLTENEQHGLNGSMRAKDNEIVNSWEQYLITQGASTYESNPRYTVEAIEGNLQAYRTTIQSGDSMDVLLMDWLETATRRTLITATEDIYPLSKIRAGKTVTIICDRYTEDFVRLEYEVDNSTILVVEEQENTYLAELAPILFDTELVLVEGSIDSSLFEAVIASGETPAFAIALADVYSSEINFITEIRDGDHFRALVEKKYYEDEHKGYGEIIAAEFTNRNEMHEAFLFSDSNGVFHYYDENGESLQRLLLKVPLDFTRVSSNYTMSRVHPIFGDVRPHQGIDYAAPMGTPVISVGDGVVKKVGWSGGFGNTVIIHHDEGFESQYAHLSRFANIKTGTRVKQGQTIAYVGSTGNSTGPHLDFRIRQNGRYINPSKLVVPRRDPIPEERMQEFEQSKQEIQSYFGGNIELANYEAPSVNAETH